MEMLGLLDRRLARGFRVGGGVVPPARQRRQGVAVAGQRMDALTVPGVHHAVAT